MKIIIVGAGEVGFHIAQRISEENQDVILIEKDPDKIRRINENLDVQAISGSGTSPEILKSSGIEDADILVAATDSDEVNLIACMLGQHLNPYVIKICRIRNFEYIQEKDLFKKDALNIEQIINPESELVDTIHSLMLVPGASEMMDFVDGRVKLVGITISENSPFAGRRLFSLQDSPDKILIGAITRGDHVFIPRGPDTIQVNDLVYLVVKTDELRNLLELFEIEDRELNRLIIVGGGDTGTALAYALDKEKINVKIIDKDPERCATLAENLDRVIVINGDGSDRDLLIEENIKDVDFMVAVTGDEESNVLISLLAKGLGAKRNITRINKLSYVPLVSSIGIDMVVSSRLSAIRAILQYIRKGKIISVAPLKGEHAEAIEAEAVETSEIVNKPLSKIKLPKGSIVGAVVRGGEIIIPKGDTIILPKDRMIFFALQKVLPKLEKLLTVKLEYF